MPDLSLLGALLVGILGCLVYAKLRPRPKMVTCAECKIPMELDTTLRRDMLDRDTASQPTMHPFPPRAAMYHCPQCGRRARLDL